MKYVSAAVSNAFLACMCCEKAFEYKFADVFPYSFVNGSGISENYVLALQHLYHFLFLHPRTTAIARQQVTGEMRQRRLSPVLQRPSFHEPPPLLCDSSMHGSSGVKELLLTIGLFSVLEITHTLSCFRGCFRFCRRSRERSTGGLGR